MHANTPWSAMSTNMHYRIQNAEVLTFLGLADIKFNADGVPSASLAMRPLKEDYDRSQQWMLKSNNKVKDSYWIESVYSKGSDEDTYKFYLTSNLVDAGAVLEEPNSAWAITLKVDKATNQFPKPFKISWKDGKSKDGKSLYFPKDGKPLAVAQNKSSGSQWKLVPVWPSMKTGVYRLRSLNGRVLTYSENRKWCVETLGGKPEYKQSWRVEGKPNGKCVIRLLSSSQDGYLVKYDDGNDGKVRMDSNKDFEWTLESVGGFAYSILADYPPRAGRRNSAVQPVCHGGRAHSEECLALTVEDDTNITLKPSKCGHGQIWLFEEDKSVSEQK
jgi:hypothetical protein